jgi:heat shock protein HslJ
MWWGDAWRARAGSGAPKKNSRQGSANPDCLAARPSLYHRDSTAFSHKAGRRRATVTRERGRLVHAAETERPRHLLGQQRRSPEDHSMNNNFLRAAVTLVAATFATLAIAQMRQKDADEPPKPLPPLQKNFPLDQTWSLRDINDKPIPAGLDASLMIDGNLRGSGYTGCNSWSATLYPVKDQHLLTGPFALTKKQCDKDVMAVEFGFLSALTGNPTWDLVNGELVIKGPKGTLRLARSL